MDPFAAFLRRTESVKVIDASIGYEKYIPLDLSVDNPKRAEFEVDAIAFETAVEKMLEQQQAAVAYGGYLEKRSLYKRSGIFNDPSTEERNIHIGLDLWIKAGTKVLAALDATVHSFAHNTGLGNYGPTIILKHESEGGIFYTLYGHLSLKSIEGLQIDQAFKKGETIGTLGDATVNGDYAPHLHFQLIRDLGNHFGDYPGVCNEKNIPFYKNNCPDPNQLLKIK